MFGVCCLMLVVSGALFVVYCVVDRCVLSVVCCLLFVLAFVVCCLCSLSEAVCVLIAA